MAFYQCRIPRCQHIKTNGTQCGSPALRNGEYCYFHFRWRPIHVDLSQSVHHVSSMFDLPVLEDADSIQMALGQIMRMIVCRQVEPRAAGLLLYGLQIASANLRRTRFEPSHREQVVVDLYSVVDRGVEEPAWSPADFANVGHVGRAPSPAKEWPRRPLPRKNLVQRRRLLSRSRKRPRPQLNSRPLPMCLPLPFLPPPNSASCRKQNALWPAL